MKTDAARKAQARYAAKLADIGDRPVTVMLSQSARNRLDILSISYGSKRAVLETLLSAD